MNRLAIIAFVAISAPLAAHAASDTTTVRSEAAAAVPIAAGKTIYSGSNRLAPIYRVTSEGNPQIVLDGKLVTIPASTLSTVDGKITTSLTKKDIGRAQ
jgi:FlaG/FlaF family flagellin (archaellin)